MILHEIAFFWQIIIPNAEYNTELAHFKMLNSALKGEDPDQLPSDPPLIVMDSKSGIDMAKNGKNSKHTRHIMRRIHFVHMGEAEGYHQAAWCKKAIYNQLALGLRMSGYMNYNPVWATLW